MQKKIDPTLDARIAFDGASVEVSTGDAKSFSMIFQNSATNTLMRTLGTTDHVDIDHRTGTATIRNEGLEIKIRNFVQIGAGRTSTLKLLVACIKTLTEAPIKTKRVEIPLKDYMESRGISDEKEARRQTNEDLNVLYESSVSFRYPTKARGKTTAAYMQDFDDYRICQHKGIRNGKIALTFADELYNMLIASPLMPYHALLLRLNDKRNPNSFYFLWRVCELKNMNIGASNEDIISVTTLLRASPKMPTYEEVMKKNRDPGRRIMEAFLRDMDALEEAFDYELWHERGRKLTDDELYNLTYSTFAGLMVHIFWKSYPDQTARLEKKSKIPEKTGGKGQQKTSHKKKNTPEN